MKKTLNFNTPWNDEYLTECNGLFCGINMPKAYSTSDNSSGNKLPDYRRRRSFLVDDYPDCPSEWGASSQNISKYFTPVKSGSALWLDFNSNFDNEFDVAIVVSIQGVNPITGLPTSNCYLEQYHEKCPVHNTKFQKNRYCKECNYKWPKQNYLSTTNTPSGKLWIDGFRTIDGLVRQYIFTEDVLKGVATHIVGNQRTFSIGISFFLSKIKKNKQQFKFDWSPWKSSPYTDRIDYISKYQVGPPINPYQSIQINNSLIRCSNSELNSSTYSCQYTNLDISAGEKIHQTLHDDSESLTYWGEEPAGQIHINYCTEDQCAMIIRNKKQINSEGFLNNIPVGNKLG